VFLCGHIAVIEEFKRKQIIKCMHTIVDEAWEYTYLNKINYYINKIYDKNFS
jgi:hypothetical protein